MTQLPKYKNLQKRRKYGLIICLTYLTTQLFNTIVITNNVERGPARDPVPKILQKILFYSCVLYI